MKKKWIWALVACGGLWSATALQARDNVVKMETTKEVGAELSFRVNSNTRKMSVDWGDGVFVSYEVADPCGISALTGVVKGKNITVVGNSNWDMLDCSGCALTALQLSEAPTLRSLYCSHNALTQMDLRGMYKLTDLDCSDNRISKLIFEDEKVPHKDLPALEYLNISNNSLTGRYYMKIPTLQHLNISGNDYTSLYVYDPNLRSLDFSHNAVANKVNLESLPQLERVICNDNEMKVLTFYENGQNLKQLVCDNNHLQTINLSAAKDISDFSCQGNDMTHLTIHDRAHFSAYNVSDNQLSFSALPSKKYKPAYYSFLPQAPLDLSQVEGMKMSGDGVYAPVTTWENRYEECIDLRSYCQLANRRADADSEWYALMANGEATKMTVRTASTEGDYSVTNGKFSFYTPQRQAKVRLTSRTYGITLESLPIAIGDPLTGVETLTAEGMKISVQGGRLVMETSRETPVKVYRMDGACVWEGLVVGRKDLTFPRGIYVVKGKKIVL